MLLAVHFVSDQVTTNAGVSLLRNLLGPALQAGERFTVADIVDQDDAFGAFVVAFSYRLKSFLPRRIPQLHLNSLPSRLHYLYFKIDADCWHMVCRKSVISKPQ